MAILQCIFYVVLTLAGIIWLGKQANGFFWELIAEKYHLDNDNLKLQGYRILKNPATDKWELEIGTGMLGGDINYRTAGIYETKADASSSALELLRFIRPTMIQEANFGLGASPDKWELIVRCI